MRTEYNFTEYQRAEIEAIDRQIMVLQIRKAEIYAVAPAIYITETPEEVEAVERVIKNLNNGPLIPKERIVALMKSEVSGSNEKSI